MSVTRIWLSSPHMGGDEERFVAEAFESNWIAPLGPNVDGFEKDIETFLGNAGSNVGVCALSSGTAAIHLALVLLGVGKGDEVICQSLTFSASANPILYQGATPVFVDSEPYTWNMSAEHLERAIQDRIRHGKKPKAIIAVDLYGMPADMDAINTVAGKFGIPVVEDAAEALGSYYHNKPAGTLGDIGILSFNGNKIITTSGGGALVCADKERVKKARFLSTQAQDPAPYYLHSHIGFNYRMSNVCAGIGRGQMMVLEDRVAQRRANYLFYKEVLEEFGIKFQDEPGSAFFSNHWLTVILKGESQTDLEAIRVSLKHQGIDSRPVWKPMHQQPIFRDHPYYGEGISDKIFADGLCLPSGSNLTEEQRAEVADRMKMMLTRTEPMNL